MFDLERQIQAWRQGLAGALGGRPDAVEELEGHLREELQRRIRSGQAPDRAWEAALRCLGTPEQLAGEFAKLPPPPLAWWPGRLVFGLLGGATAFFGLALLLRFAPGQAEPLLAAHIFTITIGYLGMFAVGTLAAWSLLARAAWGWDDQRAATLRYYALRATLVGLGLTATGVLLGACWAREHLGRFWGWDVKESGGLAVLVWYAVMLGCLHGRLAGWRTAMLVGVGGNIVVSLSWFGAPLIAPLHSYGSGSYATFLVGFVIVQVLLSLLALVPPRRIHPSRD